MEQNSKGFRCKVIAGFKNPTTKMVRPKVHLYLLGVDEYGTQFLMTYRWVWDKRRWLARRMEHPVVEELAYINPVSLMKIELDHFESEEESW